MKKIKITAANAAAIQAAIDAVQSAARVRCVSADDVIRAANEVVNVLNIPQKYMDGVCATVDPNAQKFPNAYHGIPQSTHFSLSYNGRGEAYLTSVTRETVSPPSQRISIQHTEASKAALIALYSHWD